MIDFYVTTCNEYAHLLRGFAYCFNKFWTEPQNITALYYDECPELPDNFKKISIGKQAKYGRIYTDALKEFFESIDDKYIGLICEEEYLTGKIRWGIYNQLLEYTKENVAKLDLRTNVKCGKHRKIATSIIQAHPNAVYRLSTGAAIWRRDYLLRYLKPGRDIWTFEALGSYEAVEDGEIILGTDVDIGRFREVYLRGSLSHKRLQHIPDKLLDELRGYLK
jgi:hypothetical protein